MKDLLATVRLQFHRHFTLYDAIPLVPYFARLGISHIYASPLLAARPGSTHGYDVVDPTRINPELGGEEALEKLVQALHRHEMGLIVDIVSNHMAVGGSGNPWWLDVLKWGRQSPYASFFDIQWQSSDPLMRGQLLVPFLRTDYWEVVTCNEIGLQFDAWEGAFQATHFEHEFPLNPPTYAALLERTGHPGMLELAQRFSALRDTDSARENARPIHVALREMTKQPGVPELIQQAIAFFTEDSEEGHMRLHQLLEMQHFRLASWRTASDDINWRRFFDINELGGLRVENPLVFEALHARIFELVQRGWINGLRIDHVDGLANPRAYCRKLRRRINGLLGRTPVRMDDNRFPIFVEKILAEGEELAADWGVNGTTGYEFMNQVSLLQHAPAGEETLSDFWCDTTGRTDDFMEEVYEARKLVLSSSLASDLETVSRGLLSIARLQLETRDLTLGSIRRTLTELVANFQVYRTYASGCGRRESDTQVFRQAMEGAKQSLLESDWPILERLDSWLGGQPLRELPLGPERKLRRRIQARFQQLTSPAAAKAVEDTACYRAGVILSRYDVGFDPQHFNVTAAEFHQMCQRRLTRFPGNMLTTATHDSKRGEDVRARLAVLSERAHWFAEKVRRWQKIAAPLRQQLTDGVAPTPADELILYQTLIGSWPLSLEADDKGGLQQYLQRLIGWQEKALREAKLRSSWSSPNGHYEAACRDYLSHLMLTDEMAGLRMAVADAALEIAPAGALNSLTQCLLRMTTPGFPDLYQGAEFWDFSLVDPDNRRPVNFEARVEALEQPIIPFRLIEKWRTGHIKQALIRRALNARGALPEVFSSGEYLPLEVEGTRARHLIAFARFTAEDIVVVIAPLYTAGLLEDSELPHIPASRWEDTVIRVPDALCGRTLYAAFSRVKEQNGRIAVREALAEFPVNILSSTDIFQESQL